jgi:hypothetical protein
VKAILIGVPRLLGELLRDAGMEVLADVATPDEAVETLEAHGDSLAVVASDVHVAAVHELLAHAPRARMLAISDDGTRATLYELRLHATPLADLSPAAIVAVLSR